jgi:hypothetical protein
MVVAGANELIQENVLYGAAGLWTGVPRVSRFGFGFKERKQ